MIEKSEGQKQQEFVDSVYRFSADLMFEQKKTDVEVKRILVEQGLREEDAKTVISNLQAQMKETKNKVAE